MVKIVELRRRQHREVVTTMVDNGRDQSNGVPGKKQNEDFFQLRESQNFMHLDIAFNQ